jgi:hypothetical protein
MKVIVAGSRNIFKEILGKERLIIEESGFEITELVCGMCQGVDLVFFNWANESDIIIKEFPANWNLYGKSAGPIRNKEMAQYANCLIAIWDGVSKGTKNMINEMKKLNKKVYIKYV